MHKQKKSLVQFQSLSSYFSKYKFSYIAGFVCLFIVDAAQLFIPQFTKRAVDLIASGEFAKPAVIKLSLCMVAAMLVISTGRFLWRLFIHGSSRRIESELRQKLFDHLLSLSWDFYQKNKIGDLIARSTNDIAAVRMAIGWGFVAGIDGSVMALALLVIMFVQSAHVALFAVLPLPFITILIIIFGNIVGKRFKRAQEAYSTLSDTVQETFAGIRVVKSFVKESWFIKRFAENNDDYRQASISVVKVHGLFMPMITFLSGFTSLLVLLAGGRLVVLGELSPGELVALFTYVQMLVWPMLGAGFTVNIVQRGAVSLARINEVLDSKPSIQNECSQSSALPRANVFTDQNEPIIKIQNLNFSYDEKNILNDVTLEIANGTWLGILGRTGSGKSTLIKILPRLLDPPRGTVFVKGKDVKDWDLVSLRKIFGVSPQDSFMFSDSIKNNIFYGVKKGDHQDQLTKIIDLASLQKDLELFSCGIDTVIGERGLTLSGGQKQRLAIARAAVSDPEILILDDSLSAVDAETEQHILKILASERTGKTTIIISHRVSAFSNADKIAVLNEGKVVEYGQPDELCSIGGFYAKTVHLQQLSL